MDTKARLNLMEFSRRISLHTINFGVFTLKLEERQKKDNAYADIVEILASTKDRKLDVFVLSAINIDEIYQIDQIRPDHECESKLPIVMPGGSGANTAYILGKLGHKVQVAGVVGDDDYGDLARKNLEEADIDINLLDIKRGYRTGRAVTILDNKARRLIVLNPGVNDNWEMDENQFEKIIKTASESKVFHTSSFTSHTMQYRQMEMLARLYGKVVTSISPGDLYCRQGLDRIEPIIKYTNIIFLYKEQLYDLLHNSSMACGDQNSATKDLILAYFEWKRRKSIETPQILIIKDPLNIEMGKIRETFIVASYGKERVDFFCPPRGINKMQDLYIKDTTGAGDAAAAGFIDALFRANPFDVSVDMAFRCAAFASTRIGARKAFD